MKDNEMTTTISVGLDIKNAWLSSEFTEIIAAQRGFSLTQHDQQRVADLRILELDENRGKTFAQVQAILAASPSTEVFLTSSCMEPAVLLEAIRAGVKEFIPQPVKREEVEQALQRCQERYRQRNPEQAKKGKVINVMGSKGGVGTTTIAVNLALSLQRAQPHKSVVLVDLNPQLGDAALFLDLQPAHTLGDIGKNMVRLDTTYLLSTLCQHASGLSLLSSVQDIEDLGLLTPDCVEQTLALLQAQFDYIVLDSGHMLDDTTVAALRFAPTLLLVSTLTLPVMRTTRRWLDIFSRLDVPADNIKLVVNRHKSKNREISLHDFEDTLKTKAFWLVPNDYLITLKAINTGQPVALLAKRARITQNLGKLAATLTTEDEKKPSLLTKFFGRNKEGS
jgi:pilus assembly protein CpaE